METRDKLLGQRFNERHAAGVTRYQVDRQHRNPNYYECVAVRAIEGTHHFIGSIQVFSRTHIETALNGRVFDRKCLKDEAGVCRNEFCLIHGAVEPDEVDYGPEMDSWEDRGWR